MNRLFSTLALLLFSISAKASYYVSLSANGKPPVDVYIVTPEIREFKNEDIVVMGGSGQIRVAGYGCRDKFVIVKNYQTRSGGYFGVVRPQPGREGAFLDACSAAGGDIYYGMILDVSAGSNDFNTWDQILCSVKLGRTFTPNECKL